MAEAIAVTERALHAEPALAAAEPTAAAAESTSRGTAPAAFVGIMLTGLGISVLGLHFASADTGARHTVVDACRHSDIAPYAGVTTCFLGVLILIGSLVSYLDPNGEIAASVTSPSPPGSEPCRQPAAALGGQRMSKGRQDSAGRGVEPLHSVFKDHQVGRSRLIGISGFQRALSRRCD